MKTLFAAFILLLCVSCGGKKNVMRDFDSKVAAGEFLHLRVDGGWGFDRDVWIFPDDSFRVHYLKVPEGADQEEDRVGNNPGSFGRIVSLADALNGWRITSESLQVDLNSASKGKGSILVTDADHAYLEFNLPKKKLKADFYAADSMAESYIEAREVSDFAKLEDAMRKETKER
jgi:hypothetical protein